MIKLVLICALAALAAGAPAVHKGKGEGRRGGKVGRIAQPTEVPDRLAHDLRGLSEKQFIQMQRELRKFKKRQAKEFGRNYDPDTDLDFVSMEDDIALTPEQAIQLNTPQDDGRVKRSATNGNRWSLNIPYAYDSAHITSDEMVQIDGELDYLSSVTCLNFVRKAKVSSPSEPTLLIKGEISGCWSYVGQVFGDNAYQPLNLKSRSHGSSHCMVPGIIQHEFLHAVGCNHEQSRLDRDSYVQILFDNVKDSSTHNFNTKSGENYGIQYDFVSVMHYGPRAFSINGANTIVPATGITFPADRVMGQRDGVTFLDIKLVNAHYDCASKCPSTGLITCENGGIYNTKDKCQSCLCPEGLAGEDCSTPYSSHQDCESSIIQVTSETNENCITTPNYGPGSVYPLARECGWILQAPMNRKVKVIFKDTFSIYKKYDDYCSHFIEVNTQLPARGNRYCGDIRPDNVHIGNTVLVYFSSEGSGSGMDGAKVCYVLEATDPCSSNPCNALGTRRCTNRDDGSFICRCKRRWTGTLCDTRKGR